VALWTIVQRIISVNVHQSPSPSSFTSRPILVNQQLQYGLTGSLVASSSWLVVVSCLSRQALHHCCCCGASLLLQHIVDTDVHQLSSLCPLALKLLLCNGSVQDGFPGSFVVSLGWLVVCCACQGRRFTILVLLRRIVVVVAHAGAAPLSLFARHHRR
jgi:hypothetical protein